MEAYGRWGFPFDDRFGYVLLFDAAPQFRGKAARLKLRVEFRPLAIDDQSWGWIVCILLWTSLRRKILQSPASTSARSCKSTHHVSRKPLPSILDRKTIRRNCAIYSNKNIRKIYLEYHYGASSVATTNQQPRGAFGSSTAFSKGRPVAKTTSAAEFLRQLSTALTA